MANFKKSKTVKIKSLKVKSSLKPSATTLALELMEKLVTLLTDIALAVDWEI